jgi:hypothetical protein
MYAYVRWYQNCHSFAKRPLKKHDLSQMTMDVITGCLRTYMHTYTHTYMQSGAVDVITGCLMAALTPSSPKLTGQTADGGTSMSQEDANNQYVQAAHFAAVVSISGESLNWLKDDGMYA